MPCFFRCVRLLRCSRFLRKLKDHPVATLVSWGKLKSSIPFSINNSLLLTLLFITSFIFYIKKLVTFYFLSLFRMPIICILVSLNSFDTKFSFTHKFIIFFFEETYLFFSLFIWLVLYITSFFIIWLDNNTHSLSLSLSVSGIPIS